MSQIKSFTDYFKEERDIYVQNISSYNISINFDAGGGQFMSHTFMPTRDPVNLTVYIPFKSIANSNEFRRMVNRQPKVLQLLTHDEYVQYYERQAASKNLRSVEEAIMQAQQRAEDRGFTAPPREEDSAEEQQESKRDTKGNYLSEEEVIHPRILNLCLQVHPSVPENQKMPASDVLAELDLLSDQLKFDDWEYVYSHGYYKSVKNFAKQRRDAASASPEPDKTKAASSKPATKPKPAKAKAKQSAKAVPANDQSATGE